MSRIALPNLRIGGLRQFSFGDVIYDRANLYPNLDLDFATNKNLTDNKSGKTSLVSFSRSAASSPGTYVDSQGLIKKAAVNLLKQSEKFSTSPWAVSPGGGVGVRKNQILAPDGKQTADLLDLDRVTQQINGLNGTYTYSVYLKAGNNSVPFLLAYNATTASSIFAVDFNLSSGTSSVRTGTGTHSIEDVGDGWYRCQITITVTSTSNVVFYIYNRPIFTGGFYVYAWGAQVEETDPALMGPSAYIKTTSQTLCAPRFDHEPTSGNLTTNLLTYSEMFDNATWNKGGAGVASAPVVSANTAASPDGSQTADTVTLELNGGTTSGDYSWLYENYPATASTTYTFSAWVKAATGADIGKQFRMGFTTYSDTVTLTNSWQRVQVTQTAASTTTYSAGFRLRGTEITPTVSFFVYGAQLEKSSSAGTYVRTLGETRSISDATAESLGLLVEEQRTNDIDYSHNTTTGNYGTTNITDTINQAVSPDGQNTAAKIEIDVSSGNRTFRYRTLSSSASTTYTVSFWIKNVDMPLFSMNIFSIDGGGVFTQISFLNYTSQVNGTEWSRVTHTFTSIASTTKLEIQFLRDQGTTGNSFYYWGGQLEVGSFATSTIIREGATPTRYADVAAIQDEDFSVTNLLSYSESFDVGWAYSGTTATITADATTAPDGQLTADLVTAGSTGATNFVGRTVTIPSGARTGSIYVKRGTANWVALNFGSSADTAWFDIQNLTTGTINGGGSHSISDAGNGWLRLQLTQPSSGNAFFVYLTSANNTFSGNTGDSVYLWGAQLTTTSYPVDYVSTRNLLTDSQDFERSSWVKGLATVENNDAIAPDGTSTADKIQETASTGQFQFTQNVNKTGQFVFSAYFKADERSKVYLQFTLSSGGVYAVYDLSAETTSAFSYGGASIPTATIANVGNGWFRCVMAMSATATIVTARVSVANDAGNTSYAGTAGYGALVWGAQLEPGSTATEYYRTYDVVGKNYNWYEPTEGTLHAEIIKKTDPVKYEVFASFDDDPATNKRIMWNVNPSSNIAYFYTENSGTQANIATSVLNFVNPNRMAASFGYNDARAAKDGTSATPDTTYTIPIVGRFNIGTSSYTSTANQYTGHIKRIIYFPRRIKDSNLVLMTE